MSSRTAEPCFVFCGWDMTEENFLRMPGAYFLALEDGAAARLRTKRRIAMTASCAKVAPIKSPLDS